MAEPKLGQLIRWREQYVSAALNEKFAGIIPPGIYKGFRLAPSGVPMTVSVVHGPDASSVAVVERNGYSLTVAMHGTGDMEIPAPGTWAVCIDAYYTTHAQGWQRIVLRDPARLEAHLVCIGTVVASESGVVITAEDIDYGSRQQSTMPTAQDMEAVWGALEGLNTRRKAAWTLEEDVPEGGALALPEGLSYMPGEHLLRMSWDGLVLFEGRQYEELPASEGEGPESGRIRLLFSAPAGSEFEAVVEGRVGTGSGEGGGDSWITGLAARVKALEISLSGVIDEAVFKGRRLDAGDAQP